MDTPKSMFFFLESSIIKAFINLPVPDRLLSATAVLKLCFRRWRCTWLFQQISFSSWFWATKLKTCDVYEVHVLFWPVSDAQKNHIWDSWGVAGIGRASCRSKKFGPLNPIFWRDDWGDGAAPFQATCMENRPGCSRFTKSRDTCRPVGKHDYETIPYIHLNIYSCLLWYGLTQRKRCWPPSHH